MLEENSLEFDTPTISAQYARIALLARLIAIIPREYSPTSDPRCLMPRNLWWFLLHACFLTVLSDLPDVLMLHSESGQ